MFRIAEVTEIKKAFKSGQKDETGDILPLGSIKVRLWGQNSILGNIHHIWARPSQFSRRMPLIGEHVLVYHGPISNATDSAVKTNGYFYLNPINSTDDLVYHQHPKLFLRQKGNQGSTDTSKPKPGKTFPDPPKKIDNIQIYEADDIIESRFGSSFRMGSTVPPTPDYYEQTQTWLGPKDDPITILRIKKPTGGSGTQKYTIEDLSKDESSLYMTTSQKLSKVQVAFKKSLDSAKIPIFDKPQVLIDSDRVILHAKKDMIILNAKEKAIVASKKVILQSDKYYVDLDDLMQWLQDFIKQYADLSSGTAQLATPAGPTATATNVAQVMKIANVDFNQYFKVPK